MSQGRSGRYVTARAIIIRDGAMLCFYRKRLDPRTGDYITYYSIPGGEIDEGEQPAEAAVRELREEMGVGIELHSLVAHFTGHKFEHYVYQASINDGEPRMMAESEEYAHMSEYNQYVVTWVPVKDLTHDNLHYYHHFLDVIRQLAAGRVLADTIEITLA